MRQMPDKRTIQQAKPGHAAQLNTHHLPRGILGISTGGAERSSMENILSCQKNIVLADRLPRTVLALMFIVRHACLPTASLLSAFYAAMQPRGPALHYI